MPRLYFYIKKCCLSSLAIRVQQNFAKNNSFTRFYGNDIITQICPPYGEGVIYITVERVYFARMANVNFREWRKAVTTEDGKYPKNIQNTRKRA